MRRESLLAMKLAYRERDGRPSHEQGEADDGEPPADSNAMEGLERPFLGVDQRPEDVREDHRGHLSGRGWRSDTKAALSKGTLRAPTRTTLEEAADDWLCAARAGIARTRSGDPYKPSALRSYEEAYAWCGQSPRRSAPH